MTDAIDNATAFKLYTPVKVAYQAIGTYATATTGALTVAWPTHAANDLGILIIESDDQTGSTLSTPSGFVAIPGASKVNTSASTRISAFWCRATSSSMANVVVAAVADHQSGRIITIRNASLQPNPFNIVATGEDDTSDTSLSIATMTTTADNCLILYAATGDVDSAGAQYSGEANSSLTGVAERGDDGTAGGNGGTLAIWTASLVKKGATGTFTATAANAAKKAFVQIAIRMTEAPMSFKYCMFYLDTDSTVSFIDKDGNTSELVSLKAGYQPILVKQITAVTTGNCYIVANSQLG